MKVFTLVPILGSSVLEFSYTNLSKSFSLKSPLSEKKNDAIENYNLYYIVNLKNNRFIS